MAVSSSIISRQLLVLGSLYLASAQQGILRETPFKNIEYGKPNTVVVLYWLNDPLTDAKSRALLQAAENVAARFGPQYPQLQWLKVDAAANYQDILAAQIEKKMVPIIVAAVDGVVLVNSENEMTENMLAQLVVEGYMPPQTNDVFAFSSEDVLKGVSQQTPNFVRFFASDCRYSQGMYKAWLRTAAAFRGQVQFVDVDCSRDASTKAFCEKTNVMQYPTLMWYHQGRVVPYSPTLKLDAALHKFAQMQLSSVQQPPMGARPAGHTGL